MITELALSSSMNLFERTFGQSSHMDARTVLNISAIDPSRKLVDDLNTSMQPGCRPGTPAVRALPPPGAPGDPSASTLLLTVQSACRTIAELWCG
jgi:hypothetical protein